MRWPTGASRTVFILGHPIRHVLAPEHYTPFFHSRGLDWHMTPFDVPPDLLETTIRILSRSRSAVGFNVTIPHKAAAFALCDAVGPAARVEGVVNTIRIEHDGRLVGESFDGQGFLDAARTAGVFDPRRPIVVFGAGGAGRAICHALARSGATRLCIIDTDRTRADDLAQQLRPMFPGLTITHEASFRGAGLMVNATPLGLHAGDAPPVDPATVPGDCAVFDIVAARRTELIDACVSRGLTVVDGTAMIRHQLKLQTDFWRNVDRRSTS